MNYLLIDDELYARKALAKRVMNIVGEECCEIYEAEDVPTAKIMLQKIHFDMIFLDICMPGENGLDLVEYLMMSNLTYEIVIVSGHAEFEYARKALELGVRHYLLKPADEEKLCAILLASIEQPEKKDLPGLAVLAQDVQKLIYGDEEKAIFPFKAARYLVIVIESSIQISNQLYGELFEAVSGIFTGKTGCTVNAMQPKEFVAVCGVENKEVAQLKNRLSLVQKIGEKYQDILYIGMGSTYEDLKNMSDSYEEAHSALNNRIMDRWNKVFFYTKERIKPLNDSEFAMFEEALLKRDKEGATLILKRMFRTHIEENCHFAQLQYMYHKIAGCLQEYEFLHMEEEQCLLIRSINGFRSMNDILDYFNEVIESVLSTVTVGKNGNNPMQDVLDYIDEYYYDFFSLEALAKERYYMNAKYFGKLFKDYTGVSFSRYLTKVRMEKAVEYLEDANYSVHQVSYMCGYNSVSHFIQIFKKYYNETPAKWKGSRNGM